MKKITLTNLFVAILSFTATSLIAQVANMTGLPGDDLIFHEDGKYANGNHGWQPHITAQPTVPLMSPGTIAFSTKSIDVSGNATYTLPTNRANGSAYDYDRVNRIYGFLENGFGDNGTPGVTDDDGINYDSTVWAVYDSQDLAEYDGGNKYFTFMTRFQYYSKTTAGSQQDSGVQVFYRNSATDAHPENEGGAWTELDENLIVSLNDASSNTYDWRRRSAVGFVNTYQIDFSGITCGDNFAVAIKRTTYADGPNRENSTVFSKTSNRNGNMSIGASTWTGTTAASLSVAKNNLNANISVYPNPTNSLVNISVANGTEIAQVKLSNLTGATVYANTSSKAIDVSSLAKGIYILQITTTDGTTTSSKVVVN